MPAQVKAADTIKLKKQYDDEAVAAMENGDKPDSFDEWLKKKGKNPKHTVFGPVITSALEQ